MMEPNLDIRLALREYPQNSTPIMSQRWESLLFLHWEYEAEEIQKTLPPGLFVDQFQGKAYMGITPFFMKKVKLNAMPIFSSIPDFMELNVRTYVYDETGTPGVWFYSLDANSFLVVQAASRILDLPYFYANMQFKINEEQEIDYQSQRQNTSSPVQFLYKGTAQSIEAPPGSLEFFLVERYVLFAYKKNGQLVKGRVHHAPYPLYQAEVTKWDNHLFELDGLKKPANSPQHAVFSPGVNVDIFKLS